MSQTTSYLPAREASMQTEAYKQIINYRDLLAREEGQKVNEPLTTPLAIVASVHGAQEAIDLIIESGNKSFTLLVEDNPEGHKEENRINMVKELEEAGYSISHDEAMFIVEISW